MGYFHLLQDSQMAELLQVAKDLVMLGVDGWLQLLTLCFQIATPQKFNSSPLKMVGWKMIFPFQMIKFQGLR